MELQTFAVETRSTKGKGPAGRDRQVGNVPGVVYGAGTENVNILAGAKELEYLLHHGQGEHAMVDLTFTDNADLNGPAMVKAVQHHPVRGNALHFDLVRIDLKIGPSIDIVLCNPNDRMTFFGMLGEQRLFSYDQNMR